MNRRRATAPLLPECPECGTRADHGIRNGVATCETCAAQWCPRIVDPDPSGCCSSTYRCGCSL